MRPFNTSWLSKPKKFKDHFTRFLGSFSHKSQEHKQCAITVCSLLQVSDGLREKARGDLQKAREQS